MMGRELPLSSEKPPSEIGETTLKVQGLTVIDDRHAIAVDGISFCLRQGEILGIAGVQGNGQTELVEALTGLRKPADGKVFLSNEDVTGSDPVRLYRRGLRHIPEDRRKHGMVDRFSIADNLVLNMVGEAPFSKLGVLNGTAIRHHAQQQIERFDIRTSDILAPAQILSGGNQQKLVVAREFSRPVRLLVASQPTRGIDVSATRDIHRLILEKRCEGCAVLVVSTDLDELFELSDRLVVMYRGKLTEPEDTAATDRHRVGLRMAGIGR
jgi:simple sugar transport system ATP-binding protein